MQLLVSVKEGSSEEGRPDISGYPQGVAVVDTVSCGEHGIGCDDDAAADHGVAIGDVREAGYDRCQRSRF